MVKNINVALAGQANVGKSVIFNQLTGLHQHIGNWPGKTVEKAEGELYYKGYNIHIIDLPGIYSFSTYSTEEIVSREYIILQKPDIIFNIVDTTNLERNLIFTLQLLEMEQPTVLALNMMDIAKQKGISIDTKKLEKLLGVPVVETIGVRREGLTKLLDNGLKLIKNKHKHEIKNKIRYGREVESRITILSRSMNNLKLPYPKRWLAIKLLEKDEKIIKMMKEHKKILKKANRLSNELEKIHGHDSSIVISDERCHTVSHIVKNVETISTEKTISLNDKVDWLTTDRRLGYPIMAMTLFILFFTVIMFGNFTSSLLESVTSGWQGAWEILLGGSLLSQVGWAAVESAIAIIEIAIPYVLPFYLLVYILEDSGYLARIAFLMDSFMHKLGVHGKAIIPMLLGYGCNVPACISCKIMETDRERFITIFLTTLIPCSAVTVVIMGLVGRFVSVWWALGLYVFNLMMIIIIGNILSKVLPGKSTELIMEMPNYKMPNIKTVIIQTWIRLKEFIYIAGPLVIISGMIIKVVYLAGWLELLTDMLRPITVEWLGLPAIAGVLLVFGVLRKELILVMLAALLGTTNFSSVLTSVQMITLAVVSMFYIPCIATISVLWKEVGWQRTLGIVIFEILFAIILAGIIYRTLILFL